MAFIVTADRASDLLDFMRGARFDRHVIDFRRHRFLTEKHAEFDLRRQAVQAEADRIIADIRARRARLQAAE